MSNAERKFALALKLHRRQQNLSQEELGEKVGMSKQAISRYELGAREPKLSSAAAIAGALGLKLSEMIGE